METFSIPKSNSHLCLSIKKYSCNSNPHPLPDHLHPSLPEQLFRDREPISGKAAATNLIQSADGAFGPHNRTLDIFLSNRSHFLFHNFPHGRIHIMTAAHYQHTINDRILYLQFLPGRHVLTDIFISISSNISDHSGQKSEKHNVSPYH